MICPACGVDDQQKIISTRRRNSEYILRRRECVCGHRFNSVEIIGLTEKNLKVIEREMNRNCSSPRAFQKIIYSTFQYLFDHYRWLQKKREGSETE